MTQGLRLEDLGDHRDKVRIEQVLCPEKELRLGVDKRGRYHLFRFAGEPQGWTLVKPCPEALLHSFGQLIDDGLEPRIAARPTTSGMLVLFYEPPVPPPP